MTTIAAEPQNLGDIGESIHGETHLTGLEGTNPLGFLAALGIQVIFEEEPEQPKLWWSSDVTPHAIVEGSFTIERIVSQALKVFPLWAKSPAFAPTFGNKAKDDAKFPAVKDTRRYLKEAISSQYAASFATSLVAEDSVDNNDKAKPTDLYFTAGQMKFLKFAREILSKCTGADIESGLLGPWAYESDLPSMMWDIADDRQYALLPSNPSKDEKLSNPGPEALAIIGLSTHPVFKGKDNKGDNRTLTTGCSGKWKEGQYIWPIWQYPCSPDAVKSLLWHATSNSPEKRSHSYKAWGISKILKSRIKRSDQGGYGTFYPPQIIWQR